MKSFQKTVQYEILGNKTQKSPEKSEIDEWYQTTLGVSKYEFMQSLLEMDEDQRFDQLVLLQSITRIEVDPSHFQDTLTQIKHLLQHKEDNIRKAINKKAGIPNPIKE